MYVNQNILIQPLQIWQFEVIKLYKTWYWTYHKNPQGFIFQGLWVYTYIYIYIIAITITHIFAGLKNLWLFCGLWTHPSISCNSKELGQGYLSQVSTSTNEVVISSRKICFSEDVGSFQSVKRIYLNNLQQIYYFTHFQIMKLSS